VAWMSGKWSVARRNAPRWLNKPLARAEDLVIEELGDELLVYDERQHRAHCLSPSAVRAWRACDGERTFDALQIELGLDADAVARALQELEACELLDGTPHNHNGNGLTRRDLGLRTVRVGAAAAAAPLIVSIIAPTPAAAITPTPEVCAQYNNTSCDGCCRIQGCCCGCQSGGNCKLCYPTHLCEPPAGQPSTCPGPGGGDCNCSCIGGDLPAGTPCADVVQGGGCAVCCGCDYPGNCDCTP
jgi:hypothetical protein